MNRQNNHFGRGWGLTAFLVIICSMLFYFVLFRTSTLGLGISKVVAVLNPIIYGYIIAYILNPQMCFVENATYALLKRCGVKPGRKLSKVIRVLCAFFSLFLFIVIIYALISSVLPTLIQSIQNIIFNFQKYADNVTSFIDTLLKDNEELDTKSTALITEYAGKIQEWISTDMKPWMNGITDYLTSGIFNFITFLKNFFIGIIISMYILIAKEPMISRLRRFVYSCLPISTANRIFHNLRFVDEKFGGFFIGKIIDSAIIGVICYFCCIIFDFPYPMLISVFIGVTNVIPFFGPFIGAVPATILIFVVDPLKSLLFILFILCLQQFDGNILGPRILGSAVGVSSYMVIIAILIGSGILGVTGMIIAVPCSAVIVAVVQNGILRRMKKRDLPGDLESYHNMTKIDPDTHEIIADEPRKPSNLYDWIKFRGSAVRYYDQPLSVYSWDRTMEQIEEEDRELGTVGEGGFWAFASSDSKEKDNDEKRSRKRKAEEKETAAAGLGHSTKDQKD